MSLSSTKKQIIVKFVIFTLGIFLTFAGYLVLLSLQSSINIEDGVGTASVTATYVTASLFGIVFTPILLRKLEIKTCILISQLTYLIYIVANYYPAAYTLIPAGVVVGVGEATMWPAMMLFVIHYARCYARYGTKATESYITEFIGMFYCFFQFSGVFGNLINYAILYGGSSSSQTSDNTSVTPSPIIERDLSLCGKNDCQLPNITQQYLEQYVPASQTLLYIMIGVMGALVLSAMTIHFLFIPNIDRTLEVQVPSKEVSITDYKESISNNKSYIPDETSIQAESTWKSILKTVQETLVHLIKPKQLLITPFAIYSGLLTSFALTEMSRAFGSCMLGVEQVGLLVSLAGVGDAIMSLSMSKVTSKIGRDIPMLIGFCLDISTYMICLFWIPTTSSLWVVYIIFLMAGLVDGIWQPLINEMHSAYFPEEEEIALTVWNMYALVGIAWQNGWSTSLCVYTKIYCQIAILCFAMLCHRISVYVYYRKKPEKEMEDLEAECNAGTIATRL